jgi:hypothetical protein
MSDWIDSHPTAYAAVEADELVIRIPRAAIPVIAASVVRPRSVFVGNIEGLRDEIVVEFNATARGQSCIGAIIVDLLIRGTPNATVLR